MTKMTKAQLVDENIALLEQQVAAKGAAGDEVVVATYTKRDGSHWNKVRIVKSPEYRALRAQAR